MLTINQTYAHYNSCTLKVTYGDFFFSNVDTVSQGEVYDYIYSALLSNHLQLLSPCLLFFFFGLMAFNIIFKMWPISDSSEQHDVLCGNTMDENKQENVLKQEFHGGKNGNNRCLCWWVFAAVTVQGKQAHVSGRNDVAENGKKGSWNNGLKSRRRPTHSLCHHFLCPFSSSCAL